MRIKKLLSYICFMSLVFLLASCGKKEDGAEVKEETVIELDQLDTIKPDEVKSWAAIYEKDKEILSFNKDGSVDYKGTKYDSYTIDDTYITFKNESGELKSRYQMKRKKMLLYETKEYKKEEVEGAYKDVPENSVIGLWSYDKNYSYEFTEKGTFYEDRNFPGHYLVDEAEHTIKLMYNDHFEDIYLYYRIDGDVLSIDYPWSLVPTEKGTDIKSEN